MVVQLVIDTGRVKGKEWFCGEIGMGERGEVTIELCNEIFAIKVEQRRRRRRTRWLVAFPLYLCGRLPNVWPRNQDMGPSCYFFVVLGQVLGSGLGSNSFR